MAEAGLQQRAFARNIKAHSALQIRQSASASVRAAEKVREIVKRAGKNSLQLVMVPASCCIPICIVWGIS